MTDTTENTTEETNPPETDAQAVKRGDGEAARPDLEAIGTKYLGVTQASWLPGCEVLDLVDYCRRLEAEKAEAVEGRLLWQGVATREGSKLRGVLMVAQQAEAERDELRDSNAALLAANVEETARADAAEKSAAEWESIASRQFQRLHRLATIYKAKGAPFPPVTIGEVCAADMTDMAHTAEIATGEGEQGDG